MRLTAVRLLASTALLALVIPPLVFIIVALYSGLSVTEMLDALFAQYRTRKLNLLVCGLLGWFSLLVMGVFLLISRWVSGPVSDRMVTIMLGGLIPVIVVLLWANLEYWTSFLPTRVSPGFPHGLELVIGPLIYAPIAMAIGMAVAWAASRSSR